MMLSLKKMILSLTAFSSHIVFAGMMGPVDSYKPTAYIKLGSGGSYSIDSAIFADPLYWDASPQGYGGNIGKTALYSAAFGYNYSPLLSGDIEYIYRPSYAYSKFQTSTAVNTPFFNGTKTRHFKLESNSLMGNLYIHGSGISNILKFNVFNTFNIEPFVGAGLGVSFNNMSDFHSIEPTGQFTAYAQDNLRSSLAWQFSAGLQLINESHFNLAAGYRYYNGGTFTSNKYTEVSHDFHTPWKGTVLANEFFITLGYKMDA